MTKKILIGIPSLNEEASIKTVVQAIDNGLYKYFQNCECLILNVDSNSEDNTVEIFNKTRTFFPKKTISMQLKGKGFNILKLIEFAHCENYDIVCMIDSDILSITDEWINLLLFPLIFEDYDFTLPFYSRGKYDGNITNHFCYPLLFSIFNVQIRQPIAGEFAFTRKFIQYLINQKKVDEVFGYGIDIFLTFSALRAGFKIKEVLLGTKVHKAGFKNINNISRDVIRTLLFLLTNNDYISNKPKYYEAILKDYTSIYIESKKPPIDVINKYKNKSVETLQEFRTNHEKEELYRRINLEAYIDLLINVQKVNINIWCGILAKIIMIVFNQKMSLKEIIKISDYIEPIFILRTVSYFEEIENLDEFEINQLINSQKNIIIEKLKK